MRPVRLAITAAKTERRRAIPEAVVGIELGAALHFLPRPARRRASPGLGDAAAALDDRPFVAVAFAVAEGGHAAVDAGVGVVG